MRRRPGDASAAFPLGTLVMSSLWTSKKLAINRVVRVSLIARARARASDARTGAQAAWGQKTHCNTCASPPAVRAAPRVHRVAPKLDGRISAALGERRTACHEGAGGIDAKGQQVVAWPCWIWEEGRGGGGTAPRRDGHVGGIPDGTEAPRDPGWLARALSHTQAAWPPASWTRLRRWTCL